MHIRAGKLIIAALLALPAFAAPDPITDRQRLAVVIAQRDFLAALADAERSCSQVGQQFNVQALACVPRPSAPPAEPVKAEKAKE